jgi:predicted GNAT family acetyltransferase
MSAVRRRHAQTPRKISREKLFRHGRPARRRLCTVAQEAISSTTTKGSIVQHVSEIVVHNTAKNRFELDVDGQIVFAEYRRSPGVMTFFHTLTPPALRGRGLAARVVQAALEYARAEGVKVVPLCWYVSGHIAAHPEFRDLLAVRSS